LATILEKQKAIHSLTKDYQINLDRLHSELFGLARDFKTYEELYKFIKNTTESIEEFNLAMFSARIAFLDRDTSVIHF